MLKKIDHIGVAVKSVESVKVLFQAIFNLQPVYEEIVADQKVKVVGFRIGESTFEFMEPTDPDSPVAKFLRKRGEGLHHVAISADNLTEVIAKMRDNGIRLIDEEPRIGAEGKHIAFVHPASFYGILLELTGPAD